MSVVVRIETGGAVLTLATLDLSVEVADDAGEGRPLVMRVRTDGYGISVEALNDHGQPLGGVGLDYHGNRLQGLVDVGWDNEPAVIHPICADVATARREDLRVEEDPTTRGGTVPEQQPPPQFDTSCARCRDGGRAQFYTYEFGDGRVWHFDVGLATRIALAHPETLGLVAVADLLEHTEHNEVDAEHIQHVDENIPLLAVTLVVDGNEVGILIDGNHRLRKLAALGVADAQVYLLSRELTEAAIALGPDGPKSELGRMIQLGIMSTRERSPMAKSKTRSVEYYRCWAGNNGDSGTWDTAYIDVPADTPEDRLEEAVREAVAKIDWHDGEAPVLVGLYCAGGESDEEEML
jgi:hypothetical protein